MDIRIRVYMCVAVCADVCVDMRMRHTEPMADCDATATYSNGCSEDMTVHMPAH